MTETTDNAVTQDLIDSLRSPKGGHTRRTLEYLGVPWPPKRGWPKRIIGKPRQPLSNLREQAMLPGVA